jgi:hypothetical protein
MGRNMTIGYQRLNYIKKRRENKQMKKPCTETVTVLATVFALSCLFLLLSVSALASADGEGNQSEQLPDLAVTAIKPYHYEWSEEYNVPKGDPWFNLRNYVAVVISNTGTADAGSFEVKLYADDELIGSETVEEGLLAGPTDNTTDVIFEWTPEGEDPLSWTDSAEGAICSYEDTSREYMLRVVVDEDDDILEEDEDNNELTKPEPQKVVWNGYMADEPLENYVHDSVNGGIIYSTGDGEYRSYDSDQSGTNDETYDINYGLQIPGSTKLARFYIYYTWAKPSYTAPKIAVTLETPSGDVYDLEMEKSYSDIKGDFGADIYAWGTYAYDIADYVGESGTYIAHVSNQNYGGGDSGFADKYSFAPPAILVVYEDATEPKREYWINEGADLLMGGEEERYYGGFLSLEECKNSALFSGSIDSGEVEGAVLGTVSVWGGNPTTGWHSYLYFNGNELGMDLYEGYSGSYNEEMDGLSMSIGSDDAQIGIELTDISDDLEGCDNEVIQGDDGDNMMPANAFLVITYKEEEGAAEEQTPPDISPQDPVDTQVTNTEGESRTFSISVDQTVDISWQINGTEVQTDESVTEASYTNTSATAGIWSVSAIATNRETSLSDMHTWIWNVTMINATPTPAVNITATPSPTPSNISTPTPVPTIKPKTAPTSTPAQKSTSASTSEENQTSETDEAPVPGFELALALFMLIVVAYLLRKETR